MSLDILNTRVFSPSPPGQPCDIRIPPRSGRFARVWKLQPWWWCGHGWSSLPPSPTFGSRPRRETSTSTSGFGTEVTRCSEDGEVVIMSGEDGVVWLWSPTVWHEERCDVLWGDVVWYDVLWHGMIWYDLILILILILCYTRKSDNPMSNWSALSQNRSWNLKRTRVPEYKHSDNVTYDIITFKEDHASQHVL